MKARMKLRQVSQKNPTTDKKLSDIASVSEKNYRMGAKVLNSNNEELKKRSFIVRKINQCSV